MQCMRCSAYKLRQLLFTGSTSLKARNWCESNLTWSTLVLWLQCSFVKGQAEGGTVTSIFCEGDCSLTAPCFLHRHRPSARPMCTWVRFAKEMRGSLGQVTTSSSASSLHVATAGLPELLGKVSAASQPNTFLSSCHHPWSPCPFARRRAVRGEPLPPKLVSASEFLSTQAFRLLLEKSCC